MRRPKSISQDFEPTLLTHANVWERTALRTKRGSTPAGTKVCPSVRGASNWMSPSYNPATGFFYEVTLEQCDLIVASAKEPVPASGLRGTGNEGILTEPGKFFCVRSTC